MLAVIATLEVKAGKESEFETVMKELAAKTLANEPGCKMYTLHRKGPTTYVMLERYVDRAALAQHSASEHFRSIAPRLTPVLAGAPKIETLEEVA